MEEYHETTDNNPSCMVILILVAVPFGLVFWAWLGRVLVQSLGWLGAALAVAAVICLFGFVRGWLVREVTA